MEKGENMRENTIEQNLIKQVKKLGGMALKFVSPGTTGVPDRIVILPGGIIFFAELKRPGGAPRKRQGLMIRRLKELGAAAFVIDSKEKVEKVLQEITEEEVVQNENRST